MNGSICNKPIVLIPSAAERSAKSEKSPEFYTKLFTVHSSCQVKQWYKKRK